MSSEEARQQVDSSDDENINENGLLELNNGTNSQYMEDFFCFEIVSSLSPDFPFCLRSVYLVSDEEMDIGAEVEILQEDSREILQEDSREMSESEDETHYEPDTDSEESHSLLSDLDLPDWWNDDLAENWQDEWWNDGENETLSEALRQYESIN